MIEWIAGIAAIAVVWLLIFAVVVPAAFYVIGYTENVDVNPVGWYVDKMMWFHERGKERGERR